MADRPRVRATARVLVLDPAGRVLLFGARLVDLSQPPGPVLYWYTPGGEIEPGETIRRAAVRELTEEIGLAVEPDALEGPVWLRRSVSLLLSEPVDARETYFVLRDVVHQVDVSGQTELEALEDQPHRWWSVTEIAGSVEKFLPEELADVLPEVISGPWTGPPRVVS
ncbi:MAG TPA: NUDIX domain-containing protein [Blastococcus sp.]